MMEPKDWISGFTGLVVFAAGLLPLLAKFGVGPAWFSLGFLSVGILKYLVAGFGFYLIINSMIEITNSNSIGWISAIVAVVVIIAGLLPTLASFGVGPAWFSLGFLSSETMLVVYQVLFLIEGLFLMIAAFAMEM
ncbi:hypothetical protein D6764_00140 [Candidatus Woesearchaeota archaeon]|nr:MAG: hypothetical protein D6764_00140 [Candidatus Woesearchaeota archaeon]